MLALQLQNYLSNLRYAHLAFELVSLELLTKLNTASFCLLYLQVKEANTSFFLKISQGIFHAEAPRGSITVDTKNFFRLQKEGSKGRNSMFDPRDQLRLALAISSSLPNIPNNTFNL